MNATSTPASPESFAVRPRTGRSISLVLLPAIVAIVLVSAVLTGPALRDCNRKVMGAPGDATAGGVWTAWTYERLPGGPLPQATPYTAAPEGEPFWQPYYLTGLFVFTSLWALDSIASPTCAWNLLVLGGFLLTGAALAALLLQVTRSAWAVAFGVVAYLFSPYRQIKSEGHVAYVHTELLVLLLLACLFLWRRPTKPRAVATGAVLAALAYTDGYYSLIGGTAFLVANAAALAYRRTRPDPRVSLRHLAGHIALAGVVAAGAVVPLALALMRGEESGIGAVERSYDDLVTFSARPHDFVLPSRAHPVFKHVFGDYQDRNLHGSNYSEQSLYVGWTVLLAAAIVPVTAFFARRRRPHAGAEASPTSTGRDTLVPIVFGVLALVALVMTAPPVIHLGPVAVPTVSKVIFAAVRAWRVYTRFFVLLHLALVVVAVLGLTRLFDRLRPRRQAAVGLACIGLLSFEMLAFPPQGAWSYDWVPSAYAWVAKQDDVDVVAEYPLYSFGMDPDNGYLTYQPAHGKRLLNARHPGTAQDQLRRALFGLGDPDTIPVLRRLGVDVVIVHRDFRSAPTGSPADAPPGLQLVRRFGYEEDLRTHPHQEKLRRYRYMAPVFDVDVYRVLPGLQADVAVAMGDGFYPPEPVGWASSQWVLGRSNVMVRRLAGSARQAELSFRAVSAFGVPRELLVRQAGREVWRGQIQAGAEVRAVVSVEEPIELVTTPSEQPVSEFDPGSLDRRLLAFSLESLRARALP